MQTSVAFGWLSERSGEKTFPAAGLAHAVGRALDCRAEGRGFDSRGGTNTQGLKIIEKVFPLHCGKRRDFRVAWPDDHVKWRPVSSWGRKNSVLN